MRIPIAFFLGVISFFANATPAPPAGGPSPFYLEWRATHLARLAELAPAVPGRRQSVTGIRVSEIAKILGVSDTFVSLSINRMDYQLSYNRLRTIAANKKVGASWLMAAELFDRFESAEDLARATRFDRWAVRVLMSDIYADRAFERALCRAQLRATP